MDFSYHCFKDNLLTLKWRCILQLLLARQYINILLSFHFTYACSQSVLLKTNTETIIECSFKKCCIKSTIENIEMY